MRSHAFHSSLFILHPLIPKKIMDTQTKQSMPPPPFPRPRSCNCCGEFEGFHANGEYVILKPKKLHGYTLFLCQVCLRTSSIRRQRVRQISNSPNNKPMKLTQRIFSSFLAVAFVLLLSTVIFAQPGTPGGGGDQVPIDGGLGLLAAAGGAYAIKKLRDKKKQDESEL